MMIEAKAMRRQMTKAEAICRITVLQAELDKSYRENERLRMQIPGIETNLKAAIRQSVSAETDLKRQYAINDQLCVAIGGLLQAARTSANGGPR